MKMHFTMANQMRGVAAFINYAASQGWELWQEFTGRESVDFIAGTPDGLKKVEVKCVATVQQAHGNYYYVTIVDFDRQKFDFCFVNTPDGDYFIPSEAMPKQCLSIKKSMPADKYQRKITKGGKYERYRCDITTT
jgi:hypothetical protein